LDYLPPETIFLFCEPEQLATRADEYAQQIPENDPFLIGWADFLIELNRRGFTLVELGEEETQIQTGWGERPREPNDGRISTAAREDARPTGLVFASLDAFRPLGERAPDPQVAEAQRREFFNQLHRWLRQGYAVHVFCNNDGERQRFEEIWAELVGQASSRSPSEKDPGKEIRDRRDACPTSPLARWRTRQRPIARGLRVSTFRGD